MNIPTFVYFHRKERLRSNGQELGLSQAVVGLAFSVMLMFLAACTMEAPDTGPKKSKLISAEEGGFPVPDHIIAEDGELVTDIYAQFGIAKVSGATDDYGTPIKEIWTRAYGTQPQQGDQPSHVSIPAPSLVFHPGDWLEVTLHNQLNESANEALREFDHNIPPTSQDDIKDHVPNEVNIPHNANNTNLHVHGLHVDPTEDNVTLLIIPEDDDPSNYPPELQRLIPNIDRWWEWTYGYRIPADHLPGTHWYHAHKHGATSTHVENGMAGTLVIRPNDEGDDIVPGLWSDDPGQTHDRVMVLQEVANYGVQQGSGEGPIAQRQATQTDLYTTQWPDILVNGQHQPTLALAPGQTERWRFVDAGANHRTASYLWVGELVLPDEMPDELRSQLKQITDFDSAKPYVTIGGSGTFSETFQVGIKPFQGRAKLVALDGITLREAIDVGPDNPVLLGPGNRADLFIQPDEEASGLYYIGKNFNVAPPQYVLAQHPTYGHLFQDDVAGFWRYQALITYVGGTNVENGTGAPYSEEWQKKTNFGNLSNDPFALGASYTGFQVAWPAKVNVNGSIQATKTQTTALAPLIIGKADGNGVSAAPASGNEFTFPGHGWAPTSLGGGVIDSQVLVTLNITGAPVTGGPSIPTDERLSQLSPTTLDPDNTRLKKVDEQGNLVPGIPSYVAPITDDDIEGRQVIVFDRSGINFVYQGVTQTTTINQFSLNGRQFDLNDFVGNPQANALIQASVPMTIYDIYKAGGVLGTYTFNGAGNFSNQVTINNVQQAFFTNPGYYLPVVKKDGYYTYDYENVSAPPTYQQVTGLDRPRQPMATTAEEWLLVNNSRIFHPFHIHINPFLVTEVGQMHYDTESKTWSIKTLQPGDSLGYVLNNWWDVIIIPPQGYVKIRLWLNIPDQKPSDPTDPNSPFKVVENANIFGSWVYHCHILRHEDRGMMMVVSVRPKPPIGGH